MQGLYTALYSLGFIVLTPLFLFKMWKRGKYRENFAQRFGRYSPAIRVRLGRKDNPRLWLQAVSVGEVNIAHRFLAALRQNFPQHRLVLTTTTSTGYALARERLPADVDLLYFPQDFPWTVRRAYDLIQPDAVILLEAELWPNHIWAAARRQIPVFLVNARMSPRSAARHQKFRWPFRLVWPCLNLVGVQSQPDFDNYLAAGVPRERLHLTGNMKYDTAQAAVGVAAGQLLAELGVGDRPVLVAGSTHDGEEEILFDLIKKLPALFLVLVPRHVERASEITELARRKQVKLTLRTSPAGPADCLLVNTTGELRSFYQIATVIFVGKSLAGTGGQNIVEAAASGHPVTCGPHMENFREITAQFLAAGAIIQVDDAAGLERAIASLVADPARREQIAAAAQRVIATNTGAIERTVRLIAQKLNSPT